MRRRGDRPSPAERDESGQAEASGTGAMAARGDIINSSTHVNVYKPLPLPRPEEVDPPPATLADLPFGTAMFVGREEKLTQLDDALAGPGGAVVQAVHGLGGVGKSTLAARWAQLHADDYILTWWIAADSAASVTAGLADLAGMLVPEMARSTPVASAVALQERADWARRWLAAHSSWLVVLDNVTHPADVADLVTYAPGGRFVITSRLREGWYDIIPTLIELDVLSVSESLELLRQIVSTGRSAAELAGAADLCTELGHLPLAIKQASAFIRQAHLSPAAYLDLLRETPAVMYDRTARGVDSERTIAQILRITLDALTDAPMAGRLLRIMAWWAPEAIPRTLLTPLGDQGEVTAALGDLAAYNMITLDNESVTVHRLVQAVARTADPIDPHRQPSDIHGAYQQATDLLDQSHPSTYWDPAGWPMWRALLPHIDALADYSDPENDALALIHLLDKTAGFLRDQGAVQRAITYLTRSVAANQRICGGLAPSTLESRNDLAHAYQAAGDLEQAIPLFKQTLADAERLLGSDHPFTLTVRNNLAVTFEMAGKLNQAIPLFKQTLADTERVLGSDHPLTLAARNNLAGAYESAGDLTRAIPLYRQTLAEREQVLGDDHPDTLQSRNNLAYTYKTAGDMRRAIPLLKQTLAERERVLGDDHPDTLQSRNPRACVPTGGKSGARHTPLRAEPGRAGTSTRSRPSRHSDLPQQPRLRLWLGR
jgi:tetratricopeptide (TPR) repeat protein